MCGKGRKNNNKYGREKRQMDNDNLYTACWNMYAFYIYELHLIINNINIDDAGI